jgi:S1-C subfamily serine protease
MNLENINIPSVEIPTTTFNRQDNSKLINTSSTKTQAEQLLGNNKKTPVTATQIFKPNSINLILFTIIFVLLFVLLGSLFVTKTELDELKKQVTNTNQTDQNLLQSKLSALDKILSNPEDAKGSNNLLNNFKQLSLSIVKIYNFSDLETSSGTGTIINNNGDILTNKHVIDTSKDRFGRSLPNYYVICITQNPDKAPECKYTAKLIKVGKGELDLAVLRIEEKIVKTNQGLSTASLDRGEVQKLIPKDIKNQANINPQLGSKISVLGYPGAGGDNITLTQGIYSGSDDIYLKTDAKVNSGNSGGAAFDDDGNFLGVPTGVSGGQGNIGLLTKASLVLQFINSL